MSVISRYRAEELDLIQLAPRSRTIDTVCHRTGNCIIHDIQTGVTIYDDVLLLDFHHVCHKLATLSDTIQISIVSCIISKQGTHIRFAINLI